MNRILLGGATAFVMSAGTGLISDFYTGAARMRMIARQGMAIELGGVIFLFVGGLLAEFGWAGPFALYAIAFVFLAMVLAFVPRPLRHESAASIADTSASTRRLTKVYVAALLSMGLFFTAVIRCGQKSAFFLADMIGERTVSCTEDGRDRYGWTLAHCGLPGRT